MTGSVILDVVIGLVFVYLLYSLLATIIQEIIATQLAFRAKVLEKGILRMLEDGKTTSFFPLFDRVKAFAQLFFRVNRLKDKGFGAAFYAHPLMKYLAEDNYFSKPSYLSAQNFSAIIIDLLHGLNSDKPANNLLQIQQSLINGMFAIPKELTLDRKNPAARALENDYIIRINTQTNIFLKNLLIDARGDIIKFKLMLEKWFDDTMERTTGWYKRYTQTILFIIGLLIAVTFNVDSIGITRKLSRDPKLREQMVQNAANFLKQNQELGTQLQLQREKGRDTSAATKASFDSAQNTFDSLNARSKTLVDSAQKLISNDINNVNELLALGWKQSKTHRSWKLFWVIDTKGFLCLKCNHQNGTAVIGWILTALAISLGAPFWFDLLNKLMKVRGSGIKIQTQDNANVVAITPAGTAPVTVSVNSNAGEEAVG